VKSIREFLPPQRPKASTLGQETGRLLATLVLLNAPFWLLATQLFVPRALFSLDVMLAVLLLSTFPRLGIAALALSWILDLIVATALTYHFESPMDFLRSATFGVHLGWSHLIGLRAVLLALSFAGAALVLRSVRPQRLRKRTIVLALLSLAVLDTLNGSSPLSKLDVRLVDANVAGSSMLTLTRALRSVAGVEQPLTSTGDSGGVAEFETLMPDALAGPDSVLYVLVESFGIHQDERIRHWLSQQLVPSSLTQQYTLNSSALKSSGGTTAAELRRLCGLQGSYRQVHESIGRSCLPQLMAESGRATFGLHGFSQNMFDRGRWWPMLGLQHIKFAAQLAEDVNRQCGGAFAGICDEDVISAAVTAGQQSRSFVYALTLNTHLPIVPTRIPPDLAVLCASAQTGDEVCNYLAMLGIVLRSIPAELLRQHAKLSVMVVGDHPPPFVSLQARNQFASGLVPVLVLRPKVVDLHSRATESTLHFSPVMNRLPNQRAE
jgi:hypothetical protein